LKIDILLVNPVFLSLDQAERELATPYFPLGLLYLAAFLRLKNFSVEIFDGTFEPDLAGFNRAMADLNPQVVGITAISPNREIALRLAKTSKENGALVILGGPDPTLSPQKYLNHPQVDLVVHHEGELTLVELLDVLVNRNRNISYSNIVGIAYRTPDGQVQVNPRRPYILDLDSLPQPARDMIDMDSYLEYWREHNGYASLTISLGRGCPYNCQWCQDAVHGPEFRIRSPQSVVSEVKNLTAEYNIDRLRVVDDVDGIDREWIEDWARYSDMEGVEMPFEALSDLKRKDIPMLDVRDTL